MSIHIEDLTVRFKNSVTAIDHADLDIPNGIFGLLGENGAGKTTLMRVLTTVLKPTNGMVTLDGILYSEPNEYLIIYLLPAAIRNFLHHRSILCSCICSLNSWH